MAKIFVAGHQGMVGSAIVRKLLENGSSEGDLLLRRRSELNLLNQAAVQDFFRDNKPDQVYLAAAKVGGIYANNTYPAEFLYENLTIQANVINSAFISGVKKLLFLGSSCIYPKHAEQPIREESLLTGELEPTNAPYAIAKIAGIKLCESYNRQYGATLGLDYKSVMPTNLYGPGDNYHPENSHVIPGLIQRFHAAKLEKLPIVEVWGTGTVRREFLFVDDLAEACVHVMGLSASEFSEVLPTMCGHVNVGCGMDLTISDLAALVAETVGFEGMIVFDPAKPDGTPRKLLDVSRANALGWKATTNLKQGLQLAYDAYLKSLI